MSERDLRPCEAWDVLGSLVWSHVLAPIRGDVNDALADLEQPVKDCERPAAEDVREARRALDRARALVEDQYAELADDVEPWDGGAGSTVPFGVFVEQLESRGYTVFSPGEAPVDLAEEYGQKADE